MSSKSPADGQTPTATAMTTDDGKRKAEPATGTQTRAKRNRYISLAWYALTPSSCSPVKVAINRVVVKQRVQEAQDQVQRPGALPALRTSISRVYLYPPPQSRSLFANCCQAFQDSE
ncbi:hypothetical protein TESG_05972 [Trichophyton tonsurans CBS 112818]|uniref:Uncharacterized protein n=1 Tax=Trichophyton tonsurans (strain CBS 112818) TaxID=647933 RepID=F2S546_TRIT1|nr:hypothetical protein TESG_05972 [Trichophyton tonsurans CBS 112818]